MNNWNDLPLNYKLFYIRQANALGISDVSLIENMYNKTLSTATPSYNLEQLREYVDNRFPATLTLDYATHNDPNFQPKSIGPFGNIEYMSAQHDTLPYYFDYPKPENLLGTPVIVYNNDNYDTNEAVALDAVSHGLRELDLAYLNYYLPNLQKAWEYQDPYMNALSEYYYNRLTNPDAESFDHYYNNLVDGAIRSLLVDPNSPEARGYYLNDNKYLLETDEEKKAWKEAYDYIMNNDKHILEDVYVTPANRYDIGGGILNGTLYNLGNTVKLAASLAYDKTKKVVKDAAKLASEAAMNVAHSYGGSGTIFNTGVTLGDRDPEHSNEPKGGAALAAYLLPGNWAQEVMLDSGYYKGIPGDYGLVKKAVGDRDLPVYQRWKDEDDVKREDLQVVGNYYRSNSLPLSNRTLHHAGSVPAAIYYNPNNNRYYVKEWDLNDYGFDSLGNAGTTYDNVPALQVGANLLDKVGNPVVITSGFQRINSKNLFDALIEGNIAFEDEGINNRFIELTNYIKDNYSDQEYWKKEESPFEWKSNKHYLDYSKIPINYDYILYGGDMTTK